MIRLFAEIHCLFLQEIKVFDVKTLSFLIEMIKVNGGIFEQIIGLVIWWTWGEMQWKNK